MAISLTPERRIKISETIQALSMRAMADHFISRGAEDIVFQGGTSLVMAWDSPRYSEDLDFLSSSETESLASLMRSVRSYVDEGVATLFPRSYVQLKEKIHPDSKNVIFWLSAHMEGIHGNVHVKVEFWNVFRKNFDSYKSEVHRVHHRESDLSIFFPVASPEQIYADKIVAIANRDRLKWRDLFDLWFLRTHYGNRLVTAFSDSNILLDRLGSTVGLYDVALGRIPDLLDRFLSLSDDVLEAKAVTDLLPWIPREASFLTTERSIKEMIRICRCDLAEVRNTILSFSGDGSTPFPSEA